MSARPPVLRQDFVERLQAWSRRGSGARGLAPKRVLRAAARPVRRAVVGLLDPSLRATLDEVRQAAGRGTSETDVEILRAELRTVHQSFAELSRRLEAVERAVAEAGRPPAP